MVVRFHRLIKKDLQTALAYYDSAGGGKLGDRFFQEVEKTVEKVVRNPEHFHFASDDCDGLRSNHFLTTSCSKSGYYDPLPCFAAQ